MLVEQLIYFSEFEDINNIAREGFLMVQAARLATVIAIIGMRRCKRILSGSLTRFNLPTLKMTEILKYENKNNNNRHQEENKRKIEELYRKFSGE